MSARSNLGASRCEGACIGGHCQGCCYPPIRSESPMRGNNAILSSNFARESGTASGYGGAREASSGYQQAASSSHQMQHPALSARKECSSPLKSSYNASGAMSNTAATKGGNASICDKCLNPCGCFQTGAGGAGCGSTMCSSAANQHQTQGQSHMQHSASKQ